MSEHTKQESKEVSLLFDDIIKKLKKNVTDRSQPITVDLEVRFSGLDITKSGVLRRAISKKSNKEKNVIEVNLATQIVLEPNQVE